MNPQTTGNLATAGFEEEVSQGKRFQFGKNWESFLRTLNEERILEAEKSLKQFLGVSDLKGKSFLDIGSGSGLFSLAARRLGARVHSIDYDPASVACTRSLKNSFFPDSAEWTITRGSVLDRDFIEKQGTFDICYSWGVLHHTDHLWQAILNAQSRVTDGGLLFIAIYNDQGMVSALWNLVKQAYCLSPFTRAITIAIFYPFFFLSGLWLDLINLKSPVARFTEHKKYRGMSLVHDWKDWLGGLPFEVASPARVEQFLATLGWEHLNTTPTGHGFGNNQFLFRKRPEASGGLS